MMRELARHLVVFLGVGGSDQPPVPMNGRELSLEPTAVDFEFLVVGHAYGNPQTAGSIFPAASLLGSIDWLKNEPFAFAVFAGDLVRRTGPAEIETFRRTVIDALPFPVFNAVGNHDVTDRALYESQFGNTYQAFRVGACLIVVLDSELAPGRIEGDQLEFFQETLAPEKLREVESTLIFSHKLVWIEEVVPPKEMSRFVNSSVGYDRSDHYQRAILPILGAAASHTELYWFSGDLGLAHTLPALWHRSTDPTITYVATGLGEHEDDAVLRVQVSEAGVRVRGQTLGSRQFFDASSLTPAAWEEAKRRRSDPSPWRKLIGRRSFWAGAILTAGLWLVVSLVSWVRRRARGS